MLAIVAFAIASVTSDLAPMPAKSEIAAPAELEAFRWPWQKKQGEPGSEDDGPSMEDIRSAFNAKREEIYGALQDVLHDNHPRVKKAISDAVGSNTDDLKEAMSNTLSSLPDIPLKQEVMKALDGANTDEIKAAIKEVVDKTVDSSMGISSQKTVDDLKSKVSDWEGQDVTPPQDGAEVPAAAEFAVLSAGRSSGDVVPGRSLTIDSILAGVLALFAILSLIAFLAFAVVNLIVAPHSRAVCRVRDHVSDYVEAKEWKDPMLLNSSNAAGEPLNHV